MIFLDIHGYFYENINLKLLMFFKSLLSKFRMKKGYFIISLRTDHGKEFDNALLITFCEKHGINHNFSVPYTSQQNRVVERKYRTIQEMTRSMLNESGIAEYF